MESIYSLSLAVHVFGGILVMSAGIFAILSRFASKIFWLHKPNGYLYLFGMLTVVLSSFVLVLFNWNFQFFLVNLSIIYLVAVAWRYSTTQVPPSTRFDRYGHIYMACISVVMVLFGFFKLNTLSNLISSGGLLILMGVFFLVLLGDEWKDFGKKSADWEKKRISRHLTFMLSSYLFAWASFIEVNIYSPSNIAIFFPVVVGAPLIAFFRSRAIEANFTSLK